MSYKSSLIAEKSYGFGLEVIKIVSKLPRNQANDILTRQIIRSATSIGANIEEALGSNSKKEFIHSMNIAKKEARETLYWLKIISDLNKGVDLESLLDNNQQIVNILTKIVKTTNSRLITYNQ